MKKEKKKRSGFIKAVVSFVLIAFIAYGTCFLAGPVVYPEFFGAAQLDEGLPFQNDGFVPQGVTAAPGMSERIICGYMTDGGPSRIYVLRPGSAATQINLKNEDGSDYAGHAGGITAAGRYVYISNDHKLFVLLLEDVLSAKDGCSISFSGHTEVGVNASYCSSDGRLLYVGEYHAKGYDTDESHLVETADGENRAFTLAYELDDAAPLGLKQPLEAKITFSHRDNVQGFASLENGCVALSCSSGFSSSHLYVYDAAGEPAEAADGTRLVVLGRRALKNDIKMPRMSEDLELRDGRLLMSFEAGAKKFFPSLLPWTIKNIVTFDAAELSAV